LWLILGSAGGWELKIGDKFSFIPNRDRLTRLTYCRRLVPKGIVLFEHLCKADSIPLIRRTTTVNHEACK
jgi:hypothetical protein